MSTFNPYSPPAADVETSAADAAPALWNPDAAGAWSLIFTPVFGSALLLMNWRDLGMQEKVGTARVWLIVSVIMLIPTLFFGGIGFLYIIVWYFAWQKPQATFVKERWGKDYPRKSWGKPLLFAVAGWFAAVFLIGLLMVGLTR